MLLLMFPLILLGRLVTIFNGFTFSYPQDFMPLYSLAIGLIGAGFISYLPQKKASYGLIILMGLLSFWAILPNISLYFMAHQIQVTRGTWPQVMMDDPKHLYGHVTPLYDILFNLTGYLEAFSGAWMATFFAMYFAAKSRFTPMQQFVIIGLMILILVVAILDPGNLYAWWLD